MEAGAVPVIRGQGKIDHLRKRDIIIGEFAEIKFPTREKAHYVSVRYGPISHNIGIADAKLTSSFDEKIDDYLEEFYTDIPAKNLKTDSFIRTVTENISTDFTVDGLIEVMDERESKINEQALREKLKDHLKNDYKLFCAFVAVNGLSKANVKSKTVSKFTLPEMENVAAVYRAIALDAYTLLLTEQGKRLIPKATRLARFPHLFKNKEILALDCMVYLIRQHNDATVRSNAAAALDYKIRCLKNYGVNEKDAASYLEGLHLQGRLNSLAKGVVFKALEADLDFNPKKGRVDELLGETKDYAEQITKVKVFLNSK